MSILVVRWCLLDKPQPKQEKFDTRTILSKLLLLSFPLIELLAVQSALLFTNSWGKRVGFMPFSRALVQREIQSTSTKTWTWSLNLLPVIITIKPSAPQIIIIIIICTGPLVRVFANGPRDQGSIPSWVIPKTQKMVLDACLLNTQHYKVWLKGKVEQSKGKSSTLPYTLV